MTLTGGGTIETGKPGQFHAELHTDGYDPERLEEVYDKWAAEYDGILRELAGDGTSGPTHYCFSYFRKHVPVNANNKILDAGAGTGEASRFFIEGGYTAGVESELWGVDLSAGMLDIARKRGAYHTLHKGLFPDTKHLLAESYFDAVFCCATFTHGGAPPTSLEEFVRITKPGGKVVYSVRKNVYHDESSGFQSMEQKLTQEGKWRQVLGEDGPYLPKDGVIAHYCVWEITK